MARLGSVAERVTVGHVGPTSEHYVSQGGVPFLRTQNVGDHEILSDDMKQVSRSFHDTLRKSSLRGGDLLISRVISSRVRCAIVPPALEGANCANVIVVRPGKRIDSRYLSYYLVSPNGQRALLGRQVGSAQTVINTGAVQDWLIPHPPLEEQRRIADILDRADAIRRKRREAIALTEELLRSAFLEMFGDPVGNPRGWPVRPLGDLADVNRGKFTPRPRNDPRFYGGSFPFIQTGELRGATGYLRTWRQTLNEDGCGVSRQFRRGTIAISIAANIGETAIVDFDFYCPDSVVGIVAQGGTVPEYLEFALRFFRAKLQAEAPETAQKNINLETLRPLLLPSPPSLAQERFAQLFQTVYRAAQQLAAGDAAASALATALAQEAF